MVFLGIVLFLALIGVGVWRGITVITTPSKDRYSSAINKLSFGVARGLPFWAAAVAVLFALSSFTVVDAGSIGVIQRWGQPVRQLVPGAHFILPFADTVYPVSTQTRIIKPSEDAASKDLQVVHTEVTLAYHVDPPFATQILVGLSNDAESRVIAPAILEAIKAVTARYDVQELIAKRAEVRDGIEDFVKTRLAPYHIVAETTSITNFSFSQQYEQAIEAKVTAQQHAEQAQNDLTRIRTEAEQRVARAEAEAKELRLQREQLSPELIQLRTIEKWNGELPQFIVGGGTLPMLDVLKAAQEAKRKQ